MTEKKKEPAKQKQEDHGPTNQAGPTLKEYWELVEMERADRERERNDW